MLRIESADLARMREELLFDGPDARRKLSRFWTLLALASVIATAGIVVDSTATVIGAMIVAPLMTPILGTVFSAVTADRVNLARSLGLVVAGAVAVVVISWLFALLVSADVVADTNGQVAGRVSPRLADLIAALATGAVGSFALVRSDVSDTLPGVAIAISLVPPLAVVGVTLEAGAADESGGALLLFLTNVAAILASGLVVMGLYRVETIAGVRVRPSRRLERRLTAVAVIAALAIICIPLAMTSVDVSRTASDRSRVTRLAEAWAARSGWRIWSVDRTRSGFALRVAGSRPEPAVTRLRRDLDEAGLRHVDVDVELVLSRRVALPGGGTSVP